ncbi:hypothetical protein V5O48_012386 [Marasmius crinis-equi]|uniref:DUF6533 domain-containing protein n=1 Tax=Marasmius crinis-equi TaxID=585013 RepID=A0ABR3F2X8_9AGAR
MTAKAFWFSTDQTLVMIATGRISELTAEMGGIYAYLPAFGHEYYVSNEMSFPDVQEDIKETVRTNYVGFVSFTILVWDHMITFSDEVEYIWRGRKGPIVYLFLFRFAPGQNRYFTPLGFVINLFGVFGVLKPLPFLTIAVGLVVLAYLSPVWTYDRCLTAILPNGNHRCKDFIRYEGVTVALAVEVVGLMMFLRIRALYARNKAIQGLLVLILLFETGMNAWLISRGQPVVHNPDSGRTSHACTMIFDPSISGLASASAWIPLLYDTIVFGLTINRTLPAIRRKQAGVVLKRILEDGLLYYSVIFIITLVLTIMIIAAPDGIKNILAQTEQLVTVAMMSRITISLKKEGRKQEVSYDDEMSRPRSLFFSRLGRRSKKAQGREDIPLAFPIATPPTPPPVLHLRDNEDEDVLNPVVTAQSWPRESVI